MGRFKSIFLIFAFSCFLGSTAQILMEHQSISGESGDIEIRNDTLFAISGNALEVYDVSKKTFDLLNRIYFNDILYDIQIKDTLLFISYAYRDGIEILNAKDPLNIVKLISYSGAFRYFCINDTILFSYEGIFYTSPLNVYNISDINNPVLLASIETTSYPERLSITDTLLFPYYNISDLSDVKEINFPSDILIDYVKAVDDTIFVGGYLSSLFCLYNFADPNTPIMLDTIINFEPGIVSGYNFNSEDSLLFVNCYLTEDGRRYYKVYAYRISDPANIQLMDEISSDCSSVRHCLKIPGLIYSADLLFYSFGEDGILSDSLSFPFARRRIDSTELKFNKGYGYDKPSVNEMSFFTKSENRLYRTDLNTDNAVYDYFDFGDDREVIEAYDMNGRILSLIWDGNFGESQLFAFDSNLYMTDSLNLSDHLFSVIPKGEFFYLYNYDLNDSSQMQLYRVDSLDKMHFEENIEEIDLSSQFNGAFVLEDYLILSKGDSLILYGIENPNHPLRKNSVFSRSNFEQAVLTSKKNYIYSYWNSFDTSCSIFYYKISDDSLLSVGKMSVLNDAKPDYGHISFVNDYLFLSLTGDLSWGCRNVLYDLSNPEIPLFVDTLDILPFASGVGKDNYLYASSYACGYNRVKFGELKQKLKTAEEIDFDTIMQNDSSAVNQVFINAGGEILSIDSIKGLEGVFSFSRELPLNISSGDSAYIEISFKPSAPGKYCDTAYVYSNDVYAIYNKIVVTGFCSELTGKDESSQSDKNEGLFFMKLTDGKIEYSDPGKSKIELTIYDAAGRAVFSKTIIPTGSMGFYDYRKDIGRAGVFFISAESRKSKILKKIFIF